MARSDIQAGKAFVELYVKNSKFMSGMNSAKEKLNDVGASMIGLGAKVAGVGAGIIGTLSGAIVKFAAVGDQLDKMSLRTGIASSSLAELGFAAEQSGATLENVGSTIQKMNRRIGRLAVGAGTGSQAEAVEKLGLSIQDLARMSPEQQFEAFAEAFANFGNDAAAAGLAQRAFGTGVDQLIPLLKQGKSGIADLRQEARDLGLSPSPESVAAAAQITDAINRVRRVLGAAVFEIGATLAPMASEVLAKFQQAALAVQNFIKQNRNLVIIAAKVGAGLVVVGGAIMAVGSAFLAAGAAIGVILFAISSFASAVTLAGTVLGGLVAIFGTIFSPIGILVGLLIGAGVYFVRFSETGQNAVSAMGERIGAILGSLRETFATTFGGIRDAIAAGDLALAGQIAMTSLQLVMTQGMEKITGMIGGKFGDTLARIGQQIVGGDFAGAWNTVVLGMSDIWASFTGGIVNMFADAASAVIDVWKQTINQITNMILSKAAEGGAFGKMFESISGVNVKEEMEREQRLNAQLNAAGANGESSQLFQDVRGGTFEDPATKAIADNLQARLDAIRQESDAAAQEAGQAFDANVGGAASEASGEVARIQAELEALRAEAAQSKEASDKQSAEEEAAAAMGMAGGETGGGGKASAGTFSAAAALAQNQGSAADPMVRRQVEQNKLTEKTNGLLDMIVGKIGDLGLHHP